MRRATHFRVLQKSKAVKKKLILIGVRLILCCPLFVLATYFIATNFLPREYFSKAIFEYYPKENTSGEIGLHREMFGVPFQILQSKEIIYPVIDELKLADKWFVDGQKLPKEQIHFKILKMLEIKEIRGTNMIEIGIWSRNAQEAADIANAIALQYQKRLIEDEFQLISQGVAELDKEMEKLRQKVEQAKTEVEKIRKRDGIVDPNPDTLESQDATWSAEYLAAKKNYIQQKEILTKTEDRYEQTKIEHRMSYTPAKIWEHAEPARVPARPNVPRIMLAAAGAGLLFAIAGSVLIFIGLRMKD